MDIQNKFIPSFLSTILFKPSVICFSLTCLFLLPHLLGLCPLTPDLVSNVWFTNFYKEFYLQYFTFPQTFNVENNLSLNIFPVFYGDFAYRLFAFASIFFHLTAAKALWLSLFLTIYVFIYINIYLYNLKFENIKISSMLTVIAIFTTYTLTNLYTRGAIIEFIATLFLIISINMLLIFFSINKYKYFFATGFTLFFALSSTVHPITCLLGCIFIIPLIPYAVFKFFKTGTRKSNIIFIFLLLSLYIGINGHFALATMLAKNYFSSLFYVIYYPYIDNFITRLSPLPLDIRMYEQISLKNISSPGLVSQVNILFFILITAMVAAFRSKKIIFIYSITTICFFSLVYFSVTPLKNLQALISLIQFPYRITTYSNIVLLIGFFFILQHINFKNINQQLIFYFFITHILCMGIFFIQTMFVYPVYQQNSPVYKLPSSHEVPWQVYGYQGYEGSLYYSLYPSEFSSEKLDLKPQKNYYTYKEEVYIEKETTFETNIFPFFWNKISVTKDGQSITNFLQRTRPNGVSTPGIYLTLGEPGHYSITAQFAPPLLWKILRSAYPFAFFILFGMFIWLGVTARFGGGLFALFEAIKPWKTDATKYYS